MTVFLRFVDFRRGAVAGRPQRDGVAVVKSRTQFAAYRRDPQCVRRHRQLDNHADAVV